MRIGYACLTYGNITSNFRTITKKYLTEDNLLDVIEHNLNSLEEIIDYNIQNNIKLFRITSDLIPFGSSPLNMLKWDEIFKDRFHRIGVKILNSNMRVSMHPGQYTVLNSPSDQVVFNAIEDLNYHVKILSLLNTGYSSKIILHIGGVYGDKALAKSRFINTFNRLEDRVRKRIIIENDDKSYNINDVMEIASKIKTPVVFDNLHHRINNCEGTDAYWIREAKKTWGCDDGIQKIHYSQQDINKSPGSHSFTIDLNEFNDYIISNILDNIDIMLEVKDKNLSAIKCNNLILNNHIKSLEIEWSKYKYSVLEKSPYTYELIRSLLKNKEGYPVIEFYRFIDLALSEKPDIGKSINAIEHIWGYFKDISSEDEKIKYLSLLRRFKEGKLSIRPIKNHLYNLSKKYNEDYLLSSYYFTL